MGKGKGLTGKLLVATTIVGIGLLSFGMLQLNFDLSFIGFDLTGNVTATGVPELNEANQRLLGAKVYVGDGNVISTAPRLALGEKFTLENPTVITDFTIGIATADPQVEVTGYIWDSDQSPPRRIATSAETFNGTEIGTVIGDISFTFPQALVLEPTKNVTCAVAPCEPVPINYVVGIRVDKNLDGSFTYSFKETESETINATSSGGVITPAVLKPETHVAVVDSNVDLTAETVFTQTTPRGVLGIDIFHNAPLGEDIMEDIEETIEMSENGTATEEDELVACIGLFPPPSGCVGGDPLEPQDCGLAQDLVNGVCVCKAGFASSQNTEGEAVCLELHIDKPTSAIPTKLQVPPRVDPIVFLGLGGLILGVGLIGIVVRKFRK